MSGAPERENDEVVQCRMREAGERAKAEAAARRKAAEPAAGGRPTEVNGPRGLEPTRFGDWEVKGVASDF